MKYIPVRSVFSIVILMLLAPTVSMAAPAEPPTDDPFATPVNGGVALVAVIAFLYGAYRIYQLTKKNSAENIDQ